MEEGERRWLRAPFLLPSSFFLPSCLPPSDSPLPTCVHGCVGRIIALAVVHIRARGPLARTTESFSAPPAWAFVQRESGEGRTGRQKGVEKVNRADISRGARPAASSLPSLALSFRSYLSSSLRRPLSRPRCATEYYFLRRGTNANRTD